MRIRAGRGLKPALLGQRLAHDWLSGAVGDSANGRLNDTQGTEVLHLPP